MALLKNRRHQMVLISGVDRNAPACSLVVLLFNVLPLLIYPRKGACSPSDQNPAQQSHSVYWTYPVDLVSWYN